MHARRKTWGFHDKNSGSEPKRDRVVCGDLGVDMERPLQQQILREYEGLLVYKVSPRDKIWQLS